MAFFSAPRCSSRFPSVLGAEVDDARDSSWRRWFTSLLYLDAKSSHVGVDVDRLACPLHHPMAYNCQMRGHGLLPSVVLSHHYSRRWHLSRDVKPPMLGYLVDS
jgi:hypothetical protein